MDRIKFLLLLYLLSTSFSLNPEEGKNTVNKSSKDFIEIPLRANMTTPEMVEHDGFGCETHTVKTEDGYILTIFRLYDKDKTTTGCPIFIQHGLLSSSDDWLMNEYLFFNLPYILLRQGWDVWLGNCRGNKYSLEHESLSTSDPKFWKFSFNEMGKFDIPAVIKYIVSMSPPYQQLDYIGHSMGCTMFFIAMSFHPELMNKCVRKMSALAPAVYISEAKSPIMTAADVAPSPVVQALLDIISRGQIIPEQANNYLTLYGPSICSMYGLHYLVCQNILCLIAGYNPKSLLKETLAIITGHTPSCASSLTLTHFMQYAKSEFFRQYDYGLKENMLIYGSASPPLYDLSACECPVFVVYGQNDWLVDPANVEHLILQLVQATFLKVPYEFCNHLDFVYAPFAPSMIYGPVEEFHSLGVPIIPPIP